MNDAIIGGAIAAVLGAVGGTITGLLLERRREKARRLTIVDSLIAETVENLIICETFIGQQTWWLAPYRLDAYHAYKGQLFFLSKDVRSNIVGAALIMEICSNVMQRALLQEGAESVGKSPIPPQEKLIEQLEAIHEELLKWRAKHIRSLFNRIFNKAS